MKLMKLKSRRSLLSFLRVLAFVLGLEGSCYAQTISGQCGTYSGNLLQNGSFELPPIVNPKTNNLWQVYGGGSNALFDSAPPIPGWTPNVYQVELQRTGLFGVAFNGQQYAEVDAPGKVLLKQQISTSPDRTYTLSFAYALRPDAGTQHMGVYWNGTLVTVLGGTPNPAQGIQWQVVTYVVVARGMTSELGFGSIDGFTGAGNFIDFVQLRLNCPVGLCSDSIDNDGDGVIDRADPGCWINSNDPATYDPTRDDEGAATTQCQDHSDNDSDGKVDLADPGCASAQDVSEDSDFVAAPSNLQASDNQKTSILITWNTVPGAASYDIYRSEDPNDTNPSLFVKLSSTATNGHSDSSAVPGRLYHYAVKAVLGSYSSAFSNVDSGIRASVGGGDSDGDGVSDIQEGIDGTDPMDSGSFALHLKSPAYSKYNTFLSQWNFLELVATGPAPLKNLRVTVFSLDGQPVSALTLTLAPQTQFDVDIDTLAGRSDTYGVVRLDFDDSLDGSTLSGRMTNYRPDPGAGTYSFAFSRELRNPSRGDSFAGANSYDPQGQGFLVPNWTEVVNLSSTPQTFDYRLYAQDGRLITQSTFEVPPLGERDLAAGHEQGQGVYLAEVHPRHGDAQYLSYVSRYSSNSTGGSEAKTYNYAFSLEARAGNGATQYTPSSNEAGGCFSESNWIEVSNARSIPVTASLSFRDAAGLEVGNDSIELAPKAQFHFNAGALLPKNQSGSVRIDSSHSGSLIAGSLVYFHDCSQNRVQTAYATQSRIAGRDVQMGTVNSYLGMRNELRLINGGSSVTAADITVRPFGGSASSPQHFSLGANSAPNIILNGLNASFVFPENSYGTIRVQTPVAQQVIPQVLRLRPDPIKAGAIDFVIPTVVQ